MSSSRDDWNEETPLLSREGFSRVNRTIKTPKLIYSYVLGCLVILVTAIYSIRNTLPTPLSDIQAQQKDDFPGIHCYNDYLSHFNTPHSANQRANGYLKNWIVGIAENLKQEAIQNGVDIEIIANDTTNLISKRNKFATVGKLNNKNESFLINAHYDSVSTSHGVTDNGMGTAVALELLRYFVKNPPQNTVIFLFNNFEEGGLIGAEAFALHPWFSTIKIFVNLEGTGAGGRALVLRSNNLAATQGLASSGAKLLHASPLGNDFLQAKLLKSDTDYTIFSRYGVPGMDIAFYTPRSHYHTQRDDLVHTTPEALQHMGQMALGSVRSIDEKGLLSKTKAPEPIIYYDILGRFMLAYSFKTSQIINILALIFVPVGALTWAWLSTRESLSIEQKKQTLKRNGYLMLQGFFATVMALIGMAIALFISSGLILFLNPSGTYGNIYWIGAYLAVAAFLGLMMSQFALARWTKSVTRNLDNIRVSFYGLTIFWWILLVIATGLDSQKVASTYPAIFFFLSSTVATVILVPLAPLTEEEQLIKKHTKSWLAALLAQVLVPATLIIELILFTMDCMRHTTADGTPESAICVPILLLVLHLLPWVHAAGELRKTTLVAGVVFIIMFLVCAIIGPFNNDISPNRIVFNQEYNATEGALSTVILYTGVSSSSLLQKTLKQALTTSEFDTLQCDRFMDYQARCKYQTNLNPIYAQYPKEEFEIDYNTAYYVKWN
ncbi:hypothetical protein RO3G_09418 [Rhizopus delemar RA 99-880]|uniref:Peptide hydrolase n=1 Tax=Rhizopus delemar (strain RA 99-880 / ATCC MYA-4621 / FGSC 9543 / NRRL 43880) TaxID=246409 RepID=I1C8C8_RHIO9|nr:hypothetical protein RO3G_09418 [Rhizopus delemar RA 99-880]|eukprot:EIE84708.1 hypothetical protein RO3G_09418 [Rhizopus delemar RA 99-880]